VRHTAAEVGASLETDLPENQCFVMGQPDRFEQVIVNLLRNAIDASAQTDNGCVELLLEETSQSVTLTVSDNGAGLGPLDISDLREPFFSTKPSGKGMGLGLAISGQIVDEMGGTLRACNRPNGGAAFIMTFPKGDNADG